MSSTRPSSYTVIITNTGGLHLSTRHALEVKVVSSQWSSDIKAINTDQMQNGFPGRQDVVPGRPLSPVAPLCHTAGMPAALAQKEKAWYAYSVDIFLFDILLCVISVWGFFYITATVIEAFPQVAFAWAWLAETLDMSLL